MGKQPFAVDDVGAQIKAAVESSDSPFEQALITTYTVTPGYLDWFDDLDTLVCTPSDTAEEIYRSESVDADDLEVLERDVHGKCVIVWGPERIVAWVGSFNLSHAGLFSNVEWASRFEGAVKAAFTVDDLRDDTLPATPTNNDRITQLLDTVQSLVQGTPSERVDDALRRWPAEPMLVHSGMGNSLRRSVKRCLRETTGDVTLSYFTPTVNKTGIRTLTSLAPSHLSDDQLAVEVYGAEPSTVIDTTQLSYGSFVGTTDVAELQDEFGEFVLRTRLPGDDGETLPTGSQIRGGLAHLKVLVISERDGDEQEIRDVLLTSANLTANAWQTSGGNVEYGIWLRDPERIETAGRFFLELLAECYGRADDQTLTEIDERMDAGSGGFLPYTRRTIGELLSTTLTVSSTELTVDWSTDGPPLTIEHGRWSLRNIVDGAVTTIDATVATNQNRIEIPADMDLENHRIESLELQVTTPLETPVYELSAHQLTELANDSLDEPVEEWDRLIIDGTHYSTTAELPTDVLAAADAGYLYRSHPHTLSRPIRLDATHLDAAGFEDPFLPESVLTEIRTTTQVVDELGQLPCVDVAFPTGLTPPTDSLVFESQTEAVEPVGWMSTANGRRYVFEPTLASRSITVSPGDPLDKHYPNEEHDCQLPSTETEGDIDSETTLRRLQRVREIQPQYTLSDVSIPKIPDVETPVDLFVHEDTALDITLDDSLIDVTVQAYAYESSRDGYFYNPPSKHQCTKPLTPPAPYARLTVRGLLGVETSTGPLWLYTDTATIEARKRLITALQPSADIPESLPFGSLDQTQAIMWLGFDFDNIVVEDIGEDVLADLVFDCWRDDVNLDQSRPIRALRSPPDYYAVPLFRPLLDDGVTYRIIVRPAENDTKYAWSANEYSIHLERESSDRFKLVIDDHASFEIRDDDNASLPMIGLDRLVRVRLGEEFEYHSSLETTDERRPESIQQSSETLLRFVAGE